MWRRTWASAPVASLRARSQCFCCNAVWLEGRLRRGAVCWYLGGHPPQAQTLAHVTCVGPQNGFSLPVEAQRFASFTPLSTSIHAECLKALESAYIFQPIMSLVAAAQGGAVAVASVEHLLLVTGNSTVSGNTATRSG